MPSLRIIAVALLLSSCEQPEPTPVASHRQTAADSAGNARECQEMIDELKSLEPSRDNLRLIEEMEAQRDEYLAQAKEKP